ncbi:MMP11 protein, partial [Atractosteus spatula]|nr:MMP11 protein [Atractosteus spatula]
MLSPLLLASVLALPLCAHSLPVTEGKGTNRYKAAGEWLQKSRFYNMKKRGRLHHSQETLKDIASGKGDLGSTALPGNGSAFWKRPRCGVPDYPAHRGAHSGHPRQKRFVLFGGRWEKTDLTYKSQLLSYSSLLLESSSTATSVRVQLESFWSAILHDSSTMAHSFLTCLWKLWYLVESWLIAAEGSVGLVKGQRRPTPPASRVLTSTRYMRLLAQCSVSAVGCGGMWRASLRIMRFPWQMDKEKVRQAFQEALRVWSEVTPLTFTEVASGRADIIIDFTRYWHGDNLPFDGPGGILAHAFFPRTHREGDIHFDYDETWTVGNSMGTDLLQVAAHEFGHVLGLQHSLVPGAVMSPFYSFSYPLALSDDDKQGIQYLYGPRQYSEPQTTTMTNEIIVTTPNACDTDFDAVSMIRGELFFFKSRYVWRIRDGRLQEGYPALASRHWRGIPDRIDAAFEDGSGNIWFFQGHNYWVYDGEKPITGPDSVSSLGLPISNIQAALMWGEDKNKKTYFFKGSSYWRFNPTANRVDMVYPRSLADWRGVPTSIDAAFQDSYGRTSSLLSSSRSKLHP